LQAGSRFLDIRAAKYQLDGQWRIHHGSVFADVLLNDTMSDLAKFAVENPKEVVVLKLALEDSDKDFDMVSLLEKLGTGRCIYATRLRQTMGLDQIVANGTNIIIWFEEECDFIKHDSLYAGTLAVPSDIEGYYRKNAASYRQDGKAWVWYTGVPVGCDADSIAKLGSVPTPASSAARLDQFFPDRMANGSYDPISPNIVALDCVGSEAAWPKQLIQMNTNLQMNA
jgi:hypothetical protein